MASQLRAQPGTLLWSPMSLTTESAVGNRGAASQEARAKRNVELAAAAAAKKERKVARAADDEDGGEDGYNDAMAAALLADVNEDAKTDDDEGYSKKWKLVQEERKVAKGTGRSLVSRGKTKVGIWHHLKQIRSSAARLNEQEFRMRLRDFAEAQAASKMGIKDQAKQQLVSKVEKVTTQVAKASQGRARKFDDAAAEKVRDEAALSMEAHAPQSSTGFWNIDGKNDHDTGGKFTVGVVAAELEARNVKVKRARGSPDGDPTLPKKDLLVELALFAEKSDDGSRLVKRLTDPDGKRKGIEYTSWRAGPMSLDAPLRCPTAEVVELDEPDGAGDGTAAERRGPPSPTMGSPIVEGRRKRRRRAARRVSTSPQPPAPTPARSPARRTSGATAGLSSKRSEAEGHGGCRV